MYLRIAAFFYATVFLCHGFSKPWLCPIVECTVPSHVNCGSAVHELSIAQSVVDAVCEKAGPRRVCGVRLEVGRLCAVVPDSLLFCFDVVTAGTQAEGASLRIDEIATSVRCRQCGEVFSPPDMILLCPCGSADVEILAGRELRILSMEVS